MEISLNNRMGEFEEDKKVICRFCLNITNNKNVKIIDEVIIEALDLLQLNLIKQENNTSVICDDCSVRLFAACNFKTACTDTESCIFPYVNSGSGTPVNLREIYLKERQKDHLRDVSENERICRLCMQVIIYGFTALKEIDVDMLRLYIPEVNFNFTAEPVICKTCFDLLGTHTRFVKNCLNVEEKIKNTCDFKFPETPFDINSVKMEIKSEEIYTDSSFLSLKEEPLEDASVQPEYVTTSHLDDCDTQMYECSSYDYKTSKDKNLKRHALEHGDTEKQMYKCDSCEFETLHKTSFTRHQQRHKNTPEGDMYKCDQCDYKTSQKIYFEKHQLKHKNIVEEQMFKCHLCSFKTSQKRYLTQHVVRHRAVPEEQMYKCDSCNYKTGRMDYLKRHAVRHIYVPEEEMYKCHTCDYKTGHKKDLKTHERTHSRKKQLYKCDWCDYKTGYENYLTKHRSASKYVGKGEMYRCDFCDYKNCEKIRLAQHRSRHTDIIEGKVYKCDQCNYTSGHKRYLKQHELRHKDFSEEQMFKCDLCDYKTGRKNYLTCHQLRHKGFPKE